MPKSRTIFYIGDFFISAYSRLEAIELYETYTPNDQWRSQEHLLSVIREYIWSSIAISGKTYRTDSIAKNFYGVFAVQGVYHTEWLPGTKPLEDTV